MPFNFKQLDIPGIILINSKEFHDDRGFFMEGYKKTDFQNLGIRENFVQDSISFSKKNVLRGLHYQLPPKAQGKLVRAILGKILDVAVDIRRSSSTFGKWVSVELSDENNNMVYVPPGFAHGFVILSDKAKVLYKLTEEYAPELEKSLLWNDEDLKIDWPVKIPILSDKDREAPKLQEAKVFK